MKKLIKLPIIYLINGWINLLSRKIKFSKGAIGKAVSMPDGHTYTIFRHMYKIREVEKNDGSILMIKFKFNKYTDRVNRMLSYIPVPMIAGFPGFFDKVWMHDVKNGFWYGLYQWENDSTINDYQKSFVLGMMINRADKNTLTFDRISGCSLQYFLAEHMTAYSGGIRTPIPI